MAIALVIDGGRTPRKPDHRPPPLEQSSDDGGADAARRPGDERDPGSGPIELCGHAPILA
jgi:hypothetical protein